MVDQAKKITKARRVTKQELTNKAVLGEASFDAKPPKQALRKGDACTACRRKKKRCDSARPVCTTCKDAGKDQQCEYQHESHGDALRWVKPPTKHKSSATDSGTLEFATVPVTLASRLEASSPTSSADSSLARDSPITRESSSLGYASHSYCANPALSSASSPGSNDPFCINNTWDLPVISHQFDLQDDPWSTALSDVSPGDMNLDFRLLFLTHRLKFSFYFSMAKQEAIFFGDLSNTYLDPFFIHFAHMMGCYLYQDLHGDVNLLFSQALHLHAAHEALERIPAEDAFSLAQAYHLMALACTHINLPHPSKAYAEKCVQVVNKNDLRFFPKELNKAEITMEDITEEIMEHVILLNQVLYTDVSHFLNTGESKAPCPGLEVQFRDELPHLCPILFDFCPVTLRVRSVLIVKEGMSILDSSQAAAKLPSDWTSTCENFISTVLSHIDRVLDRMVFYAGNPDYDNCISFRYSVVICLATLAETYDMLSTYCTPDLSTQYQDKRESALRDLVSMTQGFTQDCLRFLDPFLGLCWNRVLSLLMRKRFLPSLLDLDQTWTGHTKDNANIDIISRYKSSLDYSLTSRPFRKDSFCAALIDLECLLPQMSNSFRKLPSGSANNVDLIHASITTREVSMLTAA